MALDRLAAPQDASDSRAVPRDVRLAIAYMRSAVTRRLTAAELAGICGVPERTLNRHFQTFLGRTPLIHFRQMRLAAAREALLAPNDEPVSVTEVAMRFGFPHLGRFSSDFRRQFGEVPSAVLARGRARTESGAGQGKAGWLTVSGCGAGALSAPTLGRHGPSLVVLPFRTEQGEREERAFAEALAEQLAATLAREHGIEVRLARAATGEAERSGDRYGLMGRVTRSPGGRLRVVARLVDRAAGDRHLLGDAFDGAMADALALQRDVVAAAARAIRPRIEDAEIERAREKSPHEVRARDLVLRAMPLVLAADPASARRALSLLEDAIGLNPDDPVPVALAAWCRTQLLIYWATPDPAAEIALARELSDRAAALDPVGDPLVLTARSGVAMGLRRRDEGFALLARATAIDPGLGWAWERTAWLHTNRGEGTTALATFRRALPLKGPRAPMSNCLAGIGSAHFVEGRYREAAHWIGRALAENPGAIWLHRHLTPCFLGLGEIAAARMSLDTLRRAYPALTITGILGILPGSPRCNVTEADSRFAEGLAALGLSR